MSKEKALSYASAFEELRVIVQAIENGQISVDELTEKVERATLLVEVCRTKLHGTEKQVQEILRKISDPTSATDG